MNQAMQMMIFSEKLVTYSEYFILVATLWFLFNIGRVFFQSSYSFEQFKSDGRSFLMPLSFSAFGVMLSGVAMLNPAGTFLFLVSGTFFVYSIYTGARSFWVGVNSEINLSLIMAKTYFAFAAIFFALNVFGRLFHPSIIGAFIFIGACSLCVSLFAEKTQRQVTA